ncbi:hypothetical protein [Thiolapillus sp.]|uniref:hypothetical protein n=2 Tax=Thiolapillus sp. TaxID=2017437 RepID=UPI0025D4B5D4|nr:hypothetical protein [Thiolapillus sp.]
MPLRTWLPYDWTPRSEAYFVPVYKCQVIEIQLKNRKKTMRNPVQDGTIMIGSSTFHMDFSMEPAGLAIM